MTDMLEVDRLRERITQLEGELTTSQHDAAVAAPRSTAGRWQAAAAAFLIVLSCVLAPLSLVAVWANNQISDTDRYVETITPLADSPAIQGAITDAVVAEVFRYIQVDQITGEALDTLAAQVQRPAAAAGIQALKAPLVNGIESFTRTQVARVVASPEFATVWVQANRVAHDQLVGLLSGEQDGGVSAQDGAVSLNLAPIVARVKTEMLANGYTVAERIPTVNRSFVLVQSDAVTHAQTGYRLLAGLGLWLPIVTLALLGLGVVTARDRRRALARGALGIATAMLLLGVALAVARPLYLGAVPSDVMTRGAAGDVFDVLVRYLRSGLRACAVLALVVALGAYLVGPTSGASRLRTSISRGLAKVRTGASSAGVSTGPVGRFTFAHKRALRVATVLVAMFSLTLWHRPTGVIVGVTAVAVLVVAALIELVGQPPAPPSEVQSEVPSDVPEPALAAPPHADGT